MTSSEQDMTPDEFAELIEARLRERGQGDYIPEGGLDRWVAQAWPPDDTDYDEDGDLDVEGWADSWIETVDEDLPL